MINFILGLVTGGLIISKVINWIQVKKLIKRCEELHKVIEAGPPTECLRLNPEESLAFEKMLFEDPKPNEALMAAVLRHRNRMPTESMSDHKCGRLEAAGWKVGSTEDFLNDTPTESIDDLAKELIVEYAEEVERSFAVFEIVHHLEEESQNFSRFRVMQILNDMVKDGRLVEIVHSDSFPNRYALNESKES